VLFSQRSRPEEYLRAERVVLVSPRRLRRTSWQQPRSTSGPRIRSLAGQITIPSSQIPTGREGKPTHLVRITTARADETEQARSKECGDEKSSGGRARRPGAVDAIEKRRGLSSGQHYLGGLRRHSRRRRGGGGGQTWREEREESVVLRRESRGERETEGEMGGETKGRATREIGWAGGSGRGCLRPRGYYYVNIDCTFSARGITDGVREQHPARSTHCAPFSAERPCTRAASKCPRLADRPTRPERIIIPRCRRFSLARFSLLSRRRRSLL
jgi:hypothetical protein